MKPCDPGVGLLQSTLSSNVHLGLSLWGRWEDWGVPPLGSCAPQLRPGKEGLQSLLSQPASFFYTLFSAPGPWILSVGENLRS